MPPVPQEEEAVRQGPAVLHKLPRREREMQLCRRRLTNGLVSHSVSPFISIFTMFIHEMPRPVLACM